MKKRSPKNIQPGQVLNKEQKDQEMHVSPAIANIDVVGSQCPPMSLEDAIFWIEVKSKVSDLKGFVDFIQYALRNVNGFCEWFNAKFKSKEFSIVAKVGKGFYIDLTQIRELYSDMSSNDKLVSPPS